jgi:uncharacterized membrane protein YbhN (UPF0104 family)
VRLNKSTIIRVAAFAALIALAAWYVSRHRADLRQLVATDLRYLPALLAVHLASLGLNGWMNRELVAQFAVRLTFAQWYGLAAVNALGNYLPLPQAGAAVRGVYLKRLHGLSYRRYAATYLFLSVLTFVLMGASGLLSLTYVTLHGGHVSWILWLIFAAMTALAVLLSPKTARLIPGEKLRQLAEGYESLGHRSLIAKLVFWKALTIAVNTTGMWLAFRAVHRPLSWPASQVVALAPMMSNVINVTPGNTGPAEAAAYGAAALVGENGAAAVNAALVYRVTAMLVIFTLGPVFAVLLGKRPATTPSDSAAQYSPGSSVAPTAPTNPPH